MKPSGPRQWSHTQLVYLDFAIKNHLHREKMCNNVDVEYLDNLVRGESCGTIENWKLNEIRVRSYVLRRRTGIDAKNNRGTRLRFRSERAKKSRNDRSIRHRGEFLVLSFREASRVGQESVHAPPARGPQALGRRLKSRITGETKRSTAGCTVNVVGTFSSAALYSPGWNGWIEIERTNDLKVCLVRKEK